MIGKKLLTISDIQTDEILYYDPGLEKQCDILSGSRYRMLAKVMGCPTRELDPSIRQKPGIDHPG